MSVLWADGNDDRTGDATAPVARLPRYSAVALVLDVQKLLAERGIAVVVDLASAPEAINTAERLLACLGVQPTNLPEQPRT